MSIEKEKPPIDLEARVAELAKLPLLEYDQQREDAAKELGVRVGSLDKEVGKARGESEQKEAHGRATELYEPELWDTPVNGAEVMTEASNAIMRHMIIRDVDVDVYACVLWSVHTHIYRVFDHTPRILITAPDAECGKTLLMAHMIGNLVNKPQTVELMKAAPFFRLAEAYHPTYLIDEMDVFIQEDSDLAAVNNGWEPHGGVPRCVGEDNEVRIFSTHCPVAMAGIGLDKKLPSTTISRSVVVSLEHATVDEIDDADIYDSKKHKHTLLDIGRKIARWSADNQEAIKKTDPVLPPKIRNRLADKWSPLFQIAQVAGGDWPDHARKALFGQVDMSDPPKSLQLLVDTKSVIHSVENAISTRDLIERLCYLPDSPWTDYNFRQRDEDRRKITSRQLATLFKKYNIHSKQVRIDDKTLKGYERAQLQNAWSRYVDPIDTLLKSETTKQCSNSGGSGPFPPETQEIVVSDNGESNSLNKRECFGVSYSEGITQGSQSHREYF